MTDIVNFETEKNKRDADSYLNMPDGSTWFKFTADYDFEGGASAGMPEEYIKHFEQSGAIFTRGKFTIEFWARDMDEAKARIKAMRETLVLGGIICAEIRA